MVGSRSGRVTACWLLGLALASCGGSSTNSAPDEQAGSGGLAGTTGATGGSGATGGTGGSGGSGATGGSAGSGGVGGSGGSGAAGGSAGSGGVGGSGASGGSGAAGGSAGSAGVGGSDFPSCEDARKAFDEELASIQSCTADDQCGQVLEGTSCGCTRNLVARRDADATRLHALKAVKVDDEVCNALGSSCDCPATNGFACTEGRCGWNYGTEPTCEPETLGSLCIRGFPIDTGEQLSDGISLMLEFRPAGCYSSSCTTTIASSCSVEPDGDDYLATALICLEESSDPNVGCTADCGGGDMAYCESPERLKEGTHTVRYTSGGNELSVTFTVPSLIDHGGLCDSADP
jgi:hypothetical protein